MTSDDLLIGILVEDYAQKTPDFTQAQRQYLTDTITSYTSNEHVDINNVTQYVQDASLKTLLLDYGLWKETFGKEEAQTPQEQMTQEQRVLEEEQEKEAQDRESVGALRREVFNQTMDLLSSMLTGFGLTEDQINEIQQETAPQVKHSLDELGRDELNNIKSELTKTKEDPIQQQTVFNSVFTTILEQDALGTLKTSIAQSVVFNKTLDLFSSTLEHLGQTAEQIENIKTEHAPKIKEYTKGLEKDQLSELSQTLSNVKEKTEGEKLTTADDVFGKILGQDKWGQLKESATIKPETPEIQQPPQNHNPPELEGITLAGCQLSNATTSNITAPDNTPHVEGITGPQNNGIEH